MCLLKKLPANKHILVMFCDTFHKLYFFIFKSLSHINTSSITHPVFLPTFAKLFKYFKLITTSAFIAIAHIFNRITNTTRKAAR